MKIVDFGRSITNERKISKQRCRDTHKTARTINWRHGRQKTMAGKLVGGNKNAQEGAFLWGHWRGRTYFITNRLSF
jgi:hypothetical protein